MGDLNAKTPLVNFDWDDLNNGNTKQVATRTPIKRRKWAAEELDERVLMGTNTEDPIHRDTVFLIQCIDILETPPASMTRQ